MNSDLEQIKHQRQAWIDSINRNSAEDFAKLLTDDAVWLPMGQSAIAGRKTIQQWLSKPFSQYLYSYTVDVFHIRVAGEWAVERGRFVTRARKTSGEALPEHEGIYTILWRKVAGNWLIERYIDHTEEHT
ncbi:nuclear transport factor 2 family protein [candidate division KSB1 bacterium]|nr:nuclear transport factor 2 family protein [candidate division KSB1 bacterium]NIR69795.1 nuclear transport factor 2 family protein [candidate division KSB1 bacterium]NIS25785.1 nuclear transport factor 2 family protein [candidate division KSB1 bacterium]NIT72659.1 nuclear transport factor 2 family protein [candidate division KSB1 bacterium]NIU26474.1 nuclear transport factor 2 family protein [candidate division KSB1 bacterium]